MDSLTQIVLGGAVGEAVLGKKVGNKAVLWGAIGGTIPDLDTLPGQFMDTVSRLEIHRGFSHSIVFAVLMAPLLGFLIYKLYQKQKQAYWWDWTLLFFWSIFTHPLLDIFTTWGTQFFWPLEWRIAIQSIFVIDPLYTLPFLICLLAVLMLKRTSMRRSNWNKAGLILSSIYLLFTMLMKAYMHVETKALLKKQNVEYIDFDSRPSPFNSLLWTYNIETEDAFLITYRSVFDESEELNLLRFPKNHDLLIPYRNHPKVERLIFLTKGQYTLEQCGEKLCMNDLRFGLSNGLDQGPKNFVFSYEIEEGEDLEVNQKQTSFKGMDKQMNLLWERLLGV